MQTRRIKGIAVSMALALLIETIPLAAGQREPASGNSFPNRDGVAGSSSQPLPDSPGAVHSSLFRTLAVTQQEQIPIAPQSDQTPTSQNSGQEIQPQPDSPQQQASDQPQDNSSAEEPAREPAASQASSQSQPPQQPHEAVGTAAAESIAVTGVAASRPAGAAVAPAKQRRVRTLLIKVGALVGVGVAVGTTMALSQGSPSRPPGSR